MEMELRRISLDSKNSKEKKQRHNFKNVSTQKKKKKKCYIFRYLIIETNLHKFMQLIQIVYPLHKRRV